MSEPTSPKLVREIVVAFSREILPTALLAVFHRFERSVAKAGLRIRVRLLPIEELPERYDVLVVPPEMRAQAEKRAAGARVVIADRANAAVAVTALLDEITRAETLTAEHVVPGEPKIASHRGSEVL